MRPSTRVLGGAGTALVLAAIAFHLVATSRWSRRLPPGWSSVTEFIGSQTMADPVTGRLGDRPVPSIYRRDVTIAADSGSRGLILRNSYTVSNPATNALEWEYVTMERVDPGTGRYLPPLDTALVAVFPRHVRPITYRWRSNYIPGIPMAFVRAEAIEELETLLFAYRGAIEYTDSYRGTAQYPGITLSPGQEIRCSDDGFYVRVWVEPVSGEMVKLEEGCPTGDYIFDAATQARGAGVMRWEGATTGDALLSAVAHAGSERRRFRRNTIYLPMLLAGLGLACALLGMVAGRRA